MLVFYLWRDFVPRGAYGCWLKDSSAPMDDKDPSESDDNETLSLTGSKFETKKASMLPETELEKRSFGNSTEGKLLWWGDTLGVAAFALIGARNAAKLGTHPLVVGFAAACTGCGGGCVRDIICGLPVEKRSNGRIFHSNKTWYAFPAFVTGIVFAAMAGLLESQSIIIISFCLKTGMCDPHNISTL